MTERINAHTAARLIFERVGQLETRRDALQEELVLIEWTLAGARTQARDVAQVAEQRDGINLQPFLKEFEII